MSSDDIIFLIGFLAFYITIVGCYFCLKPKLTNRIKPLNYSNQNVKPIRKPPSIYQINNRHLVENNTSQHVLESYKIIPISSIVVDV